MSIAIPENMTEAEATRYLEKKMMKKDNKLGTSTAPVKMKGREDEYACIFTMKKTPNGYKIKKSFVTKAAAGFAYTIQKVRLGEKKFKLKKVYSNQLSTPTQIQKKGKLMAKGLGIIHRCACFQKAIQEFRTRTGRTNIKVGRQFDPDYSVILKATYAEVSRGNMSSINSYVDRKYSANGIYIVGSMFVVFEGSFCINKRRPNEIIVGIENQLTNSRPATGRPSTIRELPGGVGIPVTPKATPKKTPKKPKTASIGIQAGGVLEAYNPGYAPKNVTVNLPVIDREIPKVTRTYTPMKQVATTETGTYEEIEPLIYE